MEVPADSLHTLGEHRRLDDANFLHWSVVGIRLDVAQALDNLHAAADAAKDGVLAVQVRRRCQSDEKLCWEGMEVVWKMSLVLLISGIHPQHKARHPCTWLPLELGPALAMDRIPAPVCFRALVISSSNFPP